MMIYSLYCYIHTLHTHKMIYMHLYTGKVLPSCFALEENTIWQFCGGCVVTKQLDPFINGAPPQCMTLIGTVRIGDSQRDLKGDSRS